MNFNLALADYSIIKNLTDVSTKPWSKHQSCQKFKTLQGPAKTIGDWFAWNVTHFEKGGYNELTSTCDSSKTKTCRVQFDINSKGEKPYSCGIKFNMNKDQSIDLTTLECYGNC